MRQKELLDLHIKTNTLSHAYLFSGPRGVGKQETAWTAARALLCEKRAVDAVSACGLCDACRMVSAGTHPDMYMLGCNEQETRLLTRSDVERLRHRSGVSPHGSRHVFIVRDISRITREGANALLKILEEPKSNAVYFLLAEQYEDVLTTIRSRAWHVRFWPASGALNVRTGTEKIQRFQTAAACLQNADSIREYPERMQAWYTEASAALAGEMHRALLSDAPSEKIRARSFARALSVLMEGEAQFLKPFAAKRAFYEAHALQTWIKKQ
jgi:DNA polymerase III subunit delta'